MWKKFVKGQMNCLKDFCKKWKSAEKFAEEFATPVDKPLLMSDNMIQSETYQPVLITYEGPIEALQILEVLSIPTESKCK